MNRLAIYFFWDADGIVRDFVTYYVNALHDVSSKVLVVVNGTLDEENHAKLSNVADDVFCRKNVGFDVWAYKEAMDYIGWDELTSYDELILCNYTCYGPIYPFTEMFSEMDRRECDFWGVAKHPEQNSYLLPNKGGYIYEHLMSYFLVIRGKMLKSLDFLKYWKYIPPIMSKTESTALHETVFTKHFEEQGYRSDAFVNLKDYQGRCNNLSIFMADEMLINNRCPLLKRRAFFFPEYRNLLNESLGNRAIGLLNYIKQNTMYNIDLIWEDLLQTQKMSVLRNNLHFSHVIPEGINGALTEQEQTEIAVIAYIPKPFYLDIFLKYVRELDEKIQIVLLCSKDDTEEVCRLASKSFAQIEYRRVEIREENISLDCLRYSYDVFLQAKYVCCFWNYNSIQEKLRQAEEDFCEYQYSSLLGDGTYIGSVMQLMRNEPRMGMLLPMETNFAGYYSRMIASHMSRVGYLKNQFCRMNLSVPFDDSLYTNLETSFWIKSQAAIALMELLHVEERFEVAGEIGNAIDYFFPMLIQQCGYYSASVTNAKNAAIALDNFHYMQHRMLPRLFKRYGFKTWSYVQMEQKLMSLPIGEEGRVTSNENIDSILNRRFALRHLLLLLCKYPANKLADIKEKAGKKIKKLPIVASLCNVSLEGERVVFYFNTNHSRALNFSLEVSGKRYFPKRELTQGQDMLRRYLRTFYKSEALFIEIPLADLKNESVSLFDEEREVGFRWGAGFSYNALELKARGLYVRASEGGLLFQTKNKFCLGVMLSEEYGFRDKLIFAFAAMNPFHPLSIFAENLGAADNAFELFKYARKRGENAYYIASEKIKFSQKDPKIRKRILVHNGRKHCLAILFSRRWIGSFSLRVELMPSNGVLKDIHYAMLPLEWDFIPHGLTLGDKEVAMVHYYSWDNPARTFASTHVEQEAFSQKYEFKNVACLGAPRMDKWYGAKVSEKEVFFFFTWRIALSQRISRPSAEQFKQSAYYQNIIRILHYVRESFPDYKLNYAFHHEVVKQGYDELIRDGLDGLDINFIYLNTTEGTEAFNDHFRSAKYLVTDFSSVAFDFAYKEHAIPIYYLPENFIEGHYTLEPKFYDLHLGMIAVNEQQLIDSLQCAEPTKEMLERRQSFFSYLDGNNCERVYNAIFCEKAPRNFLPSSDEHNGDKNIRRLGIYFFYDSDGVVDDYVIYYLQELRSVCSKICVVVNEFLNEEGKRVLEDCCDRLIVRKNIGFDSWAYKEALESYGFDEIANGYDEVLLNNFTNYGPVYPFQEMFSEMDRRACDIWGHSRYITKKGVLIEGEPLRDHLQSYFIVFRKSILSSPFFEEYWETLRLPKTYPQAVIYHESRCAHYFEERGFVSDAYIPWKKYRQWKINNPVFRAYRQLTEDRSPLLKRKVFFVKDNSFQFPMDEAYSPYDVINYLNEHTDFKTQYILENIDRTMNLPQHNPDIKENRWKRFQVRYGFWLKDSCRIALSRELNASFSSEKFKRICTEKKRKH